MAEGCQGRPRVGAAGAKGAEGTGKAGREKRKGKRRKKKERKAQRSPHYSIIEAETSSRVAGDGRDGQQRGPRVAEGAGGGRGVEGDGRDDMVSRGRPRCFEEVEMGIFVTSSHVVDLSVCPLDHLGSSTKKNLL